MGESIVNCQQCGQAQHHATPCAPANKRARGAWKIGHCIECGKAYQWNKAASASYSVAHCDECQPHTGSHPTSVALTPEQWRARETERRERDAERFKRERKLRERVTLETFTVTLASVDGLPAYAVKVESLHGDAEQTVLIEPQSANAGYRTLASVLLGVIQRVTGVKASAYYIPTRACTYCGEYGHCDCRRGYVAPQTRRLLDVTRAAADAIDNMTPEQTRNMWQSWRERLRRRQSARKPQRRYR